MNVLGIIFDSKLQWGPQITSTLTKANKALYAISLIKSHFSTDELLKLITSNFYSVLYYNSEVWHLNSLKQSMKNQLLSISAKAIKMCTKRLDTWMLSYNNLNEMAGRATPNKLMDYKLALQLYRVVNNQVPVPDWVHLNLYNIQTRRQTTFATLKNNRLKVGMNTISNRFYHLNGKINLDWLNLSYDTYKIKCKNKFL